MTAVMRTTLWLEAPPVARDCAFVTARGEPYGGVDVGLGDAELAIYGVPDALRRLAAALVVSADVAETLALRGAEPVAAVQREAA